MSKPIAPSILAKLEPWLAQRIEEWAARGRAEPTLPVTPDGKVNVRGIVKAIGLPVHQEQHFFKNTEIRLAVNAVAEEQGVKPIGARNDLDDADTVVAARFRREAKRSSDLSKLVAEQAATIERQRAEIASLREALKIVEETGQIVRMGLPSWRE